MVVQQTFGLINILTWTAKNVSKFKIYFATLQQLCQSHVPSRKFIGYAKCLRCVSTCVWATNRHQNESRKKNLLLKSMLLLLYVTNIPLNLYARFVARCVTTNNWLALDYESGASHFILHSRPIISHWKYFPFSTVCILYALFLAYFFMQSNRNRTFRFLL